MGLNHHYIEGLQRQVFEAWAQGTPFIACEVGPRTWENLIREVELGSNRMIPPSERIQLKSITFMGVPMRCNPEVPEDKLWPLDTRF